VQDETADYRPEREYGTDGYAAESPPGLRVVGFGLVSFAPEQLADRNGTPSGTTSTAT
jgi:hypothetical protein